MQLKLLKSWHWISQCQWFWQTRGSESVHIPRTLYWLHWLLGQSHFPAHPRCLDGFHKVTRVTTGKTWTVITPTWYYIRKLHSQCHVILISETWSIASFNRQRLQREEWSESPRLNLQKDCNLRLTSYLVLNLVSSVGLGMFAVL
jgi:hypothetical protein